MSGLLSYTWNIQLRAEYFLIQSKICTLKLQNKFVISRNGCVIDFLYKFCIYVSNLTGRLQTVHVAIFCQWNTCTPKISFSPGTTKTFATFQLVTSRSSFSFWSLEDFAGGGGGKEERNNAKLLHAIYHKQLENMGYIRARQRTAVVMKQRSLIHCWLLVSEQRAAE
jgi:hypothetical protein